MNPYVMGLDIGQAEDPTALGVLHVVDEPRKRGPPLTKFNLRHLDRLELGTPYPDVIDIVLDLLNRQPLKGKCDLVVDATGVGRPIVDMFRKKGLKPIAVTITGGDKETCEDWTWRVPKRNLVMATNLLLQTGHLQFAKGMPWIEVFKKEMQSFKVKVDPLTSHDSYEAARSGVHDDLVLSVALAAWRALKFRPQIHLAPVKAAETPISQFFAPEWSAEYQKRLSRKLRMADVHKSRRT